MGDAFGTDLEALTKIPSSLSASEEIVYDLASNEVAARGNVVMEREGLLLSADSLHAYLSTQTAVAEGNIRAASGDDIFRGDRLEFNWERETGALFGGNLFLKDNNYHIKADEILKTGANTYEAKDVLITTCDGESPAWQMEGKKFDITVGGYGTVSPAIVRVKDVPLFYAPFLAFPVKLERQSGFLAPEFELYSERQGTEISQPIYWAINESSDATFYVDYMSRRGLKLGAEYRYFTSESDRGMILFDFLDDSKIDDGSGDSSRKWGYVDDAYLRPNTDRYWLRMKHDSTLGENTSLMMDLDIVSDQDYLLEFQSGYSGFSDSRNQYMDVFNRDLDDYTDTVRKNRINVNTQWPGYGLNVEALWWDDVIARRFEDTDETVQSLPVIYFDGYRQPLPGTPLYGAFETRSAYLYREDGVRGARIDLHPRIYLPLRLGRMLSIEPSLGGRETLWQVDGDGLDTGDTASSHHRELYDFKVDLSSDIYQVFRPDWGDMDALKHAVKFQVEYGYTPSTDQEDYPYFDGVDRIEGENLVTYSLVNTFTTRQGTADASDYRQAVRLELSQSWDIGLERDGDSAPFSPIEGDLQLNFGGWCYLLADAAWSTESGEWLSRNLAYRFSDKRGDRFVLQHRYSTSLDESILAASTLKLTDRIWLFSEYERNLTDDRTVSGSLDVVYRAQCWSIEARYQREAGDTSFAFVLTLHGLGDMGGHGRHSEGLASWAMEGF